MDKADNPVAARPPRFDLDEQGMHHLGPVHWNLTAPYLYEHAIRARRRRARAWRRLCRQYRPSYRPLAARQIHRQRARHQRHGLVGQHQPADRPRALRQPAAADARLSAGPRAVRAGPLCRRRPGIPAAGAGDQPQRLAQPVRAQHVHPAARGRAGRFPAGLHDPARARFQGDPGARRHPLGDLHPGQFRRAASC